jgi:hypothetical protein
VSRVPPTGRPGLSLLCPRRGRRPAARRTRPRRPGRARRRQSAFAAIAAYSVSCAASGGRRSRTALKPLGAAGRRARSGGHYAATTGGGAGADRRGASVGAARQWCCAASRRQGSGGHLAADGCGGGPVGRRDDAWASRIRELGQFVSGCWCAQESAAVCKGDEGAVRAGGRAPLATPVRLRSLEKQNTRGGRRGPALACRACPPTQSPCAGRFMHSTRRRSSDSLAMTSSRCCWSDIVNGGATLARRPGESPPGGS